MTTGYSSRDYVLSAKVSVKKAGRRARKSDSGPSVSAEWMPLAFGGRGIRPGQLGTGHGVTLIPNSTTLAVSDRPNAEIDRFSPAGEDEDTVHLPAGSFPCDADF